MKSAMKNICGLPFKTDHNCVVAWHAVDESPPPNTPKGHEGYEGAVGLPAGTESKEGKAEVSETDTKCTQRAL